MRQPVFTKQFEKDVKRVKSRGRDPQKLKVLLAALISEERLMEQSRDHALMGAYHGRRECHIEPDWLLIYKLEQDRIIFERTGTHADLFE